MKKKYEMLKVRDKADSYVIKKVDIPDVPFRMLLVAKSGQGKTSAVVNLLLRPTYYLNDFKGEDMFIVSGSLSNDNKLQTLVKQKDIPASNLFKTYDEEELQVLYDYLTKNYEDAIDDGEKPPHSFILFDDMSFGGSLKKKMNGNLQLNIISARNS